MAYRMVYLRIQCCGYDPQSPGSTDLTAFEAESHRLFQRLGGTRPISRHYRSICHERRPFTAKADELRLRSQPADRVEGQIALTF